MRFIGKFHTDFYERFWTTIGDTVYYPTKVQDPMLPQYATIRIHEQVHIEQYRKYKKYLFLFLYLFFPLPVLFSYFRWKFEREAFLVDIENGANIDLIVETLQKNYFYCWPKSWMRNWFIKATQKK
jgi:hypothetical protein